MKNLATKIFSLNRLRFFAVGVLVFASMLVATPVHASAVEVTLGTYNTLTGVVHVEFPIGSASSATYQGHRAVYPTAPADGGSGSCSPFSGAPAGYIQCDVNIGDLATLLGGGHNNVWFMWTPDTGSTTYYYQMVLSGAGRNVNNADGVNPVNPVDASTVAYNVVFSGTYNNNATYDQIVFSISDLTDSISISAVYSLSAVNGFNIPYSFTRPLTPNHSYEYQAWLRDSSDSSITAVSSVSSFDTSALVLDTPAWEPEICDSIITDFGACIRNLLHQTFYPTPESLAQFSTLTLANSLPFSYVYDIGTLYNELLANGGSMEANIELHTAIGDMQLISASQLSAVPFASTIKTLLGYMMYLFTIFFVYSQLKRVFS